MEQFSHDLTVALEETSKSGGVRTGCWGARRRTRSTGNLPCAPQPTEDSSSSPADGRGNHHMGPGGSNDAILSDSDDRQELKLTLNARKVCMLGNFESDSLNETTFSPARPNTRRKRKLKRMAVEYETTPSTPGTTSMAGAIGDAAAAADFSMQHSDMAALPEATQPMASTSDYHHAGPSNAVAVAPSFAHLQPSALASTSPAAGAAFPHQHQQQQLQPGILGQAAFNAASLLKKRSLKYHGGAENFRANLFFCGKRKRSHRDRYYEQHSSSVPRQRDHLLYNGKNSYSEYRSRNRSFSSAAPKPCERIAPLTNSIVSKIEKISQDTRQRDRATGSGGGGGGFRFDEAAAAGSASIPAASIFGGGGSGAAGLFGCTATDSDRIGFNAIGAGGQTTVAAAALMQHPPTTFSGLASLHLAQVSANAAAAAAANPGANPGYPFGTSPRFGTACGGGADGAAAAAAANPHTHHKQHHKDQHAHPTRKQQRRTKRLQMKMRLQFDDPNAMDAMAMADGLVSSSSMSSSSDSEAAQRNDTDREGDDELTDWPGNEAMVNFASKNDFKRAKPRGSSVGPPGAGRPLPFIRGGEEPVGDDDTLMSADEMFDATDAAATAAAGLNGLGTATAAAPPNTLNLLSKYAPMTDGGGGASGLTQPIAIHHSAATGAGLPEAAGSASFGAVGSMGAAGAVVREIRAGCRRVRNNERPGFAILTSVNEDLSRFLQDVHKEQLRLPDPNAGDEREKLAHLAQLYSLSMHADNGYVILTKTSNTMQSVRIDRSSSIPKRYLSDYKRRCYGGDEDPESSGMAS